MRYLIYLILPVFLFCCNPIQEEETFTIGFSQCTMGDAWRQAMVNEMKRELSFDQRAELIVKDAGNSSGKQIQQIREFIEADVDLLIVSPNEAEPITPVVEEAFEKGIPVIIVDRKTSSSLYTAFVGADNYEIGQLTGDYIGEKLNGKGKVIEVWGLKGSSPAIDRHNGFKDALAKYEDIVVVKEIDGQWEKDLAKKNFAQHFPENVNADLIFAHNDVMALGVYEYLKSQNKEKNISFIGIDGLGGPNGGMQFVEDGILSATFLYPTGGEEVIRLAEKILNNEPYEKENILHSTLIDDRNVRIMKRQTNKILNQQKDIERQQAKITEQLKIYQNQRNLLYIILAGMMVIIVLGALALLALREKQEVNKILKARNKQVVNQRNEIALMAKKADMATEAKFRFFTNISHEFRTPLTLILGPVEEILRSNISQELKNDMQLVKNNAIRLLKLVNQLMDFRKIENKKMILRAAEQDLIGFIRDVLSSFENLAFKRNIDLKLISEQDHLKVYFDTDKIDKVLFNLLSNAFKFTKDGGSIQVEVELSVDYDKVIIAVEDNGRGMSAEHVAHAFDRFYTGENYSDLSTGLGLALSKEFIDIHKGEISVVSEKWKGTKFVITLPLGKEHLKENEIISDPNWNRSTTTVDYIECDYHVPLESFELEDEINSKEYTVLLIEDNQELRLFLKTHLSRTFNVEEARDGLLGLNKAYETVPDLIICDVMLPNKNGLEVTSTLKNDLRTSHIPVILLTAKDSIDQKIEGVQAGADLYVTKPFSYEYLYERIKALISKRQLLKNHYLTELPVDIKSSSSQKQLDKKFINDFIAVVEENISNTNLSANDIATQLGLSKVQVYRKVKALLGYSVNEYVVNVRLKKAKHLLLNSEMNISEIAYKVGFSTPAYFSTAFKNHFELNPSEYKATHLHKKVK